MGSSTKLKYLLRCWLWSLVRYGIGGFFNLPVLNLIFLRGCLVLLVLTSDMYGANHFDNLRFFFMLSLLNFKQSDSLLTLSFFIYSCIWTNFASQTGHYSCFSLQTSPLWKINTQKNNLKIFIYIYIYIHFLVSSSNILHKKCV